MPLIEVRQLSAHTRLGLWCIDETAEGSPRQRERQAVQSLLYAMTDGTEQNIRHEASGKPFLEKGGYISISHTRGYAALLLSDAELLGVDIEYRSDRVERIASRFIRTDETALTTDEKLLIWSTKEAVYKLFSEDKLMFFDMQTLEISPRKDVDGQQTGLLRMKNLKRNIVVDVLYEFTGDYVLTYATLPA